MIERQLLLLRVSDRKELALWIDFMETKSNLTKIKLVTFIVPSISEMSNDVANKVTIG